MNQNPVIVCLDASTPQCSAALLFNGQMLARKSQQERGHSGLLLSWIEEMLAEAGLARSALDAIAFSQGPGSFTGVRIASGVTQGLAFGLDRPTIAISSLQLLAEQAAEATPQADGLIVSLLDARMGELYGGVFARNGNNQGQGHTQLVGGEWLRTPENVPLPDTSWQGVGAGFSAYPALQPVSAPNTAALLVALPDARFGLALAAARYRTGQIEPAHGAQPVYLRNDIAKKARGLSSGDATA